MIYFIEAVGANLVKIGFTDRAVEDRLRELQTASPHPLRLIAAFDGGIKEEGDHHEQFSHLRTTGEWFRMDGELRGFIQAAKWLGAKFKRESDSIRDEAAEAIRSALLAQDQTGWILEVECLCDRVNALEAKLRQVARIFNMTQPGEAEGETESAIPKEGHP